MIMLNIRIRFKLLLSWENLVGNMQYCNFDHAQQQVSSSSHTSIYSVLILNVKLKRQYLVLWPQVWNVNPTSFTIACGLFCGKTG